MTSVTHTSVRTYTREELLKSKKRNQDHFKHDPWQGAQHNGELDQKALKLTSNKFFQLCSQEVHSTTHLIRFKVCKVVTTSSYRIDVMAVRSCINKLQIEIL